MITRRRALRVVESSTALALPCLSAAADPGAATLRHGVANDLHDDKGRLLGANSDHRDRQPVLGLPAAPHR
jgi:hypothetical protein